MTDNEIIQVLSRKDFSHQKYEPANVEDIKKTLKYEDGVLAVLLLPDDQFGPECCARDPDLLYPNNPVLQNS